MRLLRGLLQRSGEYLVQSARSAPEAVALLAREPFDVAIIDGGAWERLWRAAANGLRWPESCILLLTDGPSRVALPKEVHGGIERTLLAEPARVLEEVAAAADEYRSQRRKETMVRWLAREARTDDLTGLHNRAAFDERLAEAVEESRRAGTPVAVVVLDVEGTRIVNEAHGQEAGDAMLRRAAAGITRCVRGADFAARVGGDDFAVIVPGGDLALGRLIARRIGHEIERLNAMAPEGEIEVTVTFGVASATACGPEELLAAAQAQLGNGSVAHPPLSIFRKRGGGGGPSVA
ncbi:MAG: GGDEF domain-containing protein [Tepidiformaceae bacterium]